MIKKLKLIILGFIPIPICINISNETKTQNLNNAKIKIIDLDDKSNKYQFRETIIQLGTIPWTDNLIQDQNEIIKKFYQLIKCNNSFCTNNKIKIISNTNNYAILSIDKIDNSNKQEIVVFNSMKYQNYLLLYKPLIATNDLGILDNYEESTIIDKIKINNPNLREKKINIAIKRIFKKDNQYYSYVIISEKNNENNKIYVNFKFVILKNLQDKVSNLSNHEYDLQEINTNGHKINNQDITAKAKEMYDINPDEIKIISDIDKDCPYPIHNSENNTERQYVMVVSKYKPISPYIFAFTYLSTKDLNYVITSHYLRIININDPQHKLPTENEIKNKLHEIYKNLNINKINVDIDNCNSCAIISSNDTNVYSGKIKLSIKYI